VRASLATAQVALATALLAMAGLSVVSLVNVARVELGIERDGLVTFGLSPSLNGYTPVRTRGLFDRLEEELRGLPGVVSVTASTHPMLTDNEWSNNLTVEGFQGGPDTDTTAFVARTGTDYFRTLGIPLLAGREFRFSDVEGSPQVAIVNEAFARKFNLGSRTIGTRMAMGAGGNRPLDIEIVGLVRDAKYRQIRETAPAQFFLPYRQDTVGSLTFYARTAADTRPLAGAIVALVGRIDATLPISNLHTMNDQIYERMAPERVLSTLSSSFAVLATLLGAIGLYAVLAYGVSQRLREFGIRIALGAQGRDVRWMVLSQVGRITVVGGAVGAGLALGLGRLGQALLFGVDDHSTAVIGGAALVVLAVALGAGFLPARVAASVNPVEALRAD
jgi:predicted permease